MNTTKTKQLRIQNLLEFGIKFIYNLENLFENIFILRQVR